ncbi:MAG: hypothetical protein VYC91_00180, partial [Acidobacteriota bacterium]|nr:hypothetical protein [Acidobacteriota bacterium]
MTSDKRLPEQIAESTETTIGKVVLTEQRPYFEEELSLVDLWVVLIKRKVLIGAVVVASLLSGIVFFVFPRTNPPQQYEFSTIIEIGQEPDGEPAALVDFSETVLAKLQNAYIPLARKEFNNREETERLSAPAVQVHMLGRTVVLKTVGSSPDSGPHLELLESVSQHLLADHRLLVESHLTRENIELERERLRLEELKNPEFLAVEQNALENQISLASSKLEELGDRESLINERIERISDQERLVRAQIAELEKAITQGVENRFQAVSQSNNPSKAMTLLLIDSGLSDMQARFASLQERLEIELRIQEDELFKSLADISRERQQGQMSIEQFKHQLEKIRFDWARGQADQEEVVNDLEERLRGFRETRVILPPMQSLAPPAAVATITLVATLSIAGFLGIALGIFAAFGAEFIANAR